MPIPKRALMEVHGDAPRIKQGEWVPMPTYIDVDDEEYRRFIKNFHDSLRAIWLSAKQSDKESD